MECPGASRHFPIHSIKRLLVDVGVRGHCHIVVKPTGVVRYLKDHITAECSTSRFYIYAYVTFLCCIVCATIVPLEWNRVTKLSFPCSHFMKRYSCGCISVLFLRALKRHVSAADTQHLSLSTFAPFSGAMLCNRTARALLHPCPPNRDCSRNASLSPTMGSVPTAPTSPAFVYA